MTGESTRADRWPWMLAAIVAGGAALRLAGLGTESVDLEEYACTGALHTRGLHDFLIEQRALYPYGAPLAPLLFYFWSGLFGVSIVAVRLLSALAGTVLILLPVLLAREVWHDNPRTARTAGLIAALCVALSPVHLFQAQEARMYAFVALFAALSGFTLLRAVRTGKGRWWVLNFAVNAALVWSHYFAAFLWPAQALWLLFARGLRRRTLLCWLGVHALLLVPVGLWMSGIAPQPKELHDYYITPDLALVARNLVAGDAVHWSSSTFSPSGRAWLFAPDAVRRVVLAAHPVGDAIVAVAFSAALLWGVLRLFRRRSAQGAHTTYLVLWGLLPLTLLVILSFAWKPIYASRYLVHASLALYLLLGGLLARLSAKRLALCVGVLALVFAWQLSLALPPQSRTAWKEAGAAIEAADGPQAITLIQGAFWKPVFESNLTSSDHIVTAVFEPETMAEMGAFLVKAISVIERGTDPSCWVVLVDAIHGQTDQFEAAAARLGMHLEKHDFSGERHLDAYRVSPDPGNASGILEPVSDALLDLVQTIAERSTSVTIASLKESVRTKNDKEGGGYVRLGIELVQKGRTALSAAVLGEAMVRFPAYMADLVRMERLLSGRGVGALAERVFERIKGNPERIPELRQMLQSLLEREELYGLVDVSRRMINAFPEYSLGYAYLGTAQSYLGDYGYALQNLERAVALDPAQSGRVYYMLGILYVGAGRCTDALRVLEQGLARDPIDGGVALLLADAHLNCGDAARAAALITEQMGNATWANRMPPAFRRTGETLNSAPAALLDVARSIFAHADDPVVADFLKTLHTRPGMEGCGCLRLGVDLARKGNVELSATVLDAAVGRFPAHLLDLAILQSGLSGGDAAKP